MHLSEIDMYVDRDDFDVTVDLVAGAADGSMIVSSLLTVVNNLMLRGFELHVVVQLR